MSKTPDPTQPTETLASIRKRLQQIEDDMRGLRDAYWAAGDGAASMAVDTARHGVSRSLHDLQRCDHKALS